MHQANGSIAREEREEACVDLQDRVEDWKALRMETFGELVLFGTFTVLKGDGGTKDQEKEVIFPSLVPDICSGSADYYILVPHISLRTHSALLQGYQHEQAKSKDEINHQSSRQA